MSGVLLVLSVCWPSFLRYSRHSAGERTKKGGGGGGAERQRERELELENFTTRSRIAQREKDRGRGKGGRKREKENSNSKTLKLKDSREREKDRGTGEGRERENPNSKTLKLKDSRERETNREGRKRGGEKERGGGEGDREMTREYISLVFYALLFKFTSCHCRRLGVGRRQILAAVTVTQGLATCTRQFICQQSTSRLGSPKQFQSVERMYKDKEKRTDKPVFVRCQINPFLPPPPPPPTPHTHYAIDSPLSA